MEKITTRFSSPVIADWSAARSRDARERGLCAICHARSRGVGSQDEEAVRAFFASEKPEVVVLAAAKVGGIKANNDYPVEFLLENLRVQNNVISAAHENGARKLLFLGSSCIYPKHAPQPIPESALLTGPLEPTNDAYAIAKIAGIKLCQAYARRVRRQLHLRDADESLRA